MYKVVVVDDETWICKLIRKIVNWEDMGFKIIADAGDGVSALELVKEHRPDLVITDIRMPSLDGIGLIKSVRELGFDTEFIIISGYSDFEYAKSAIKYYAFGYIVKPLDKDEFQEILLSVKEKIQKKYAMETKIENSELQMLEQEIKKIIDLKNKNICVENLNQVYGTNFGDGEYCVAISKQDFLFREKCDSYDNTDLLKLLTEIKESHSEKLKELVHFTDGAGDKYIFVLNFIDREFVLQEMRRILTKIQEKRKSQEQFSLTIGVGQSVSNINQIGMSYRSALCAINARMVMGTGNIIDAETQSNKFADTKNIIDVRKEKKLKLLLDVFDTKGASEEIANILKQADKQLSNNAIIYHLAAYEIIDILFDVMENKNVQLESLTKELVMQNIENSLSKTKIELYINQFLKEFSEAYSEAKQKNGDKLIGEIKTYIMENYMSDISLDDVAKLVCLNPTYVSEVFKKKTSENFSEYLSDYRVNIAKTLLKDVRYKIIDISLMVGYKDPKYFSRLFKKKVGVNPTDYRNMYV